jgi:hypothetical protein
MQIFEFQFNPGKKDYKIEVLSYQIKNKSKYLFVVGELKNIIPGNENLLSKTTTLIKNEFNLNPLASAEDSLKSSLIKVNESLAIEISKDNVSWLGNLHLSVVSIFDNNVSASKIGKMELFHIKGLKIDDLDGKIKEELNESKQEVYVKTFSNVVSGKISKNEKILVTSNEVIGLLKKEGIIDKILSLPHTTQKSIEDLLGLVKKDLSKISGVLFLLDFKDQPKDINKKDKKEVNFSLKEVYLPIIFSFKNIFLKNKRENKKNPTTGIFNRIKKELKKSIVLIFLLLFFLFSGFLIFSQNKEVDTEIVDSLNERKKSAEELIYLGNKKEGTDILKDVYSEALEYKNLDLALDIENIFLSLLNIEEPKEVREIISLNSIDFIPEKIITTKDNIYLYSLNSNKIAEIDQVNLEINHYLSDIAPESATKINEIPFFFSKPNNIFKIENHDLINLGSINVTQSLDLYNINSFYSNIYFYDLNSFEILKYSKDYSIKNYWFKDNTKKPTDILSMSVDDHIWILNRDNKISKYYKGEYVNEFLIDLFPFSSNFSEIKTSLNVPYLFISDNKSLILINKEGLLIKQIKSNYLNNLKYFDVIDDKIFILNDLGVYQLTI